MDSFVCRSATVLIFAAISVGVTLAQSPPALDWRRVGNTVVDLSLASPAGGPVDRVWYSSDGQRVFARTASGRIWQTSDFESWQAAADVEPPERKLESGAPDGAVAIANGLRASRLYAAGRFAYRSDDGGLNWTNLTRNGGTSIIGGALRDAATSPRNPDEVIVAGTNGLWRSLDGGDSWTGLNEGFPNLPVQRILFASAADNSVHIVVSDSEFAWHPGEGSAWRPTQSAILAAESQLKSEAATRLGVNITAIAVSGAFIYAGSADGALLVSRDGGGNWAASGAVAGIGRVDRIVADSRESNTAVASTQSALRAKVLRTTTGGVFWEDLTGNLPASVKVRGVTFDRASNAVYAATDRGIYFTYADSGAVSWTLLRAGAATDVALDPGANQLYVAMEEAGIFAALAPHRMRDPRVVSAADRVARAAAPGSLLSVIGARVQSARIGDQNAPVLAASDVESQIQVPFNTAGTNVQLAAQTSQGNRQVGLTVLPTSPSIFVDPDGVALVMNADTGLVLDPAAPARSGARLQVLATGLGQVAPEWPTGLAAPVENAPKVVAPVRAFLDREPLEVTRATLAPGYVGMYLVEVRVPAIVNRGTAEFYIEAQNQPSNRIRIYLEP